MCRCNFPLSIGGLSKVQAAPIVFGSNAYELVLVSNPFSGSNNSWFTADTAAQASSFMGVNGHLVTITSAAENDFLADLAVAANAPLQSPGFTGAWLGGRAGTGWLAGPENSNAFTYDNFGGGEPNNAGYAYMAIALNPGAAGLSAIGQWLDDSGAQGFPSLSPADPVVGYFVEYENVSVVPVPAALPLLLSGLLGLGLSTPIAATKTWSPTSIWMTSRSSSERSEASQAFIFLRDSATKRRETADFEVPSPRAFARCPRADGPRGGTCGSTRSAPSG